MKSRETVNISVRKQRDREYIYLRKTIIIDGRKVDKRISTGLEATSANLAYAKQNGVELFRELMGETKENRVILFEDFYQEALDFLGLGVTEETKQRRVTNIINSVLPILGKRNLLNISPYDIEQWQTQLYLHRGGDYTSRVKSLLRRIFDRAMVKKLIHANPCHGTAPIKKEPKQRREIYTQEEVERMIQEADLFLRAFIYVMATLGVRTGEAVGLMFDDFDHQIHKLHLQRSIRHGKISPPKTGERYIDVPPRTLELVKQLQEQSSSQWLFATKDGGHYHDGATINQKRFQPFLEKLAIPYKSLYSLRHFHATLALIKGQDLAYLSKQIGHANIKTTLDFYVGYMPNSEHSAKKGEIFNF